LAFKIKLVDWVVAIAVLCAVAASFFAAYSGSAGSSTVTLKSENGEWVYPLDAVETVKVPGPLGETIVEIGGGEARVSASPCVNQTCVSTGAVRRQGQWTACLPNRVMLYISEGNDENNVDAIAW
jgi:hypothetical protein